MRLLNAANLTHSVAILLTTASLLAGCKTSAKTEEPTQVLAKVNGDEITVSQMNFALSRVRPQSEQEMRAVSRQILDALIEQQLLIQKAKAAKLDRDPRVVQSIENSKNLLLAQAYLEQLSTSQKTVSKDETRKFYGEHPEMFKQRHIYRFQELVTGTLTADQAKALQVKMGGAPTLNTVSEWLKSEKIAFNAETVIQPAEQLPSGLLEKVRGAKGGQLIVIPQGNRVQILQLVAAQSAPMEEAAAAPYIERFLRQQRQNEAAANEVKRLRQAASIEYKGEFAKTVAAATPATAAPAAKTEADDYIGRGVGGLH